MKILTKTVEAKPVIRLKNFFSMVCLRKASPDTVDLNSAKCVFKHIKLKTAEKLYNTTFTPSDNEYGEYVYKTFALSIKTGKPVEVLVIPKKINDNFEEEFYILDPRKVSKNTISVRVNVQNGLVVPVSIEDNLGMKVIGQRSYNVNERTKEILPGTMSSRGNVEYLGLGLIEHQLAIERMLMRNFHEISIYSIPSAYKFHKNCGFEVIKQNCYVYEKQFQEKVAKYSELLNLDEDTVKSMMIYRKKLNGDYILDENSSVENFLNYVAAHNLTVKNFHGLELSMRLTKGALREWKKIIEKHPILMGQKIPDKISPKGFSK